MKVSRRIALCVSAGAMAASALAFGLTAGSTAATNPNFTYARNTAGFGLVVNAPGGSSFFRGNDAVAVNFRVNGQGMSPSGFNVPFVTGNEIVPSSASANGIGSIGSMTNAISISVDVVSGPLNTVYAPSNAFVTLNRCTACNALAADYTFVVSSGQAATILPAGFTSLDNIANQVNADAHANEPSLTLANQVIAALNDIAGVLNDTNQVDPPVPPTVQRFGQLNYQSS